MIHADRKEGRGGGVALYIHKNFNDYKIRKDIHIQGAEDIFIKITNDSGKNNSWNSIWSCFLTWDPIVLHVHF